MPLSLPHALAALSLASLSLLLVTCCPYSANADQVTCDCVTTDTTCAVVTSCIGGELPPALASLQHLEVISLSSLSLHGTIPAGLGSLTGLTTIQLADNQLHGTIPSSFSSLSLRQLALSFNSLSGHIDQPFGAAANKMLVFGFNDNRFSGE